MYWFKDPRTNVEIESALPSDGGSASAKMSEALGKEFESSSNPGKAANAALISRIVCIGICAIIKFENKLARDCGWPRPIPG